MPLLEKSGKNASFDRAHLDPLDQGVLLPKVQKTLFLQRLVRLGRRHQAKVANFHVLPVAREEHVGWLQIAMDKLQPMKY